MNNKKTGVWFFVGIGFVVFLFVIFLFLKGNEFDLPIVEYKYHEIESPKEVVDEYIKELENILKYIDVSQMDDNKLDIEVKEKIMNIKTPAQYRDEHMQLFLSIDKEGLSLQDIIQTHILEIKDKK